MGLAGMANGHCCIEGDGFGNCELDEADEFGNVFVSTLMVAVSCRTSCLIVASST